MQTRIRHLLCAFLFLTGPAVAQIPSTIPPNSALGRLGVSAGPPQIIPFATLFSLLRSSDGCDIGVPRVGVGLSTAPICFSSALNAPFLLAGPVHINPPTLSPGLKINQFTSNAGQKTSDFFYNDILISDRIGQTVGATYGLNVNMHMGSVATGGKAAIRGEVDLLNSGVATGSDIVGVVGTVFANHPNGGTLGSAAGRMYGFASAPILVNGATDFDVLTGLEVNIIAETGASVDKRWGISLQSGGDVQGASSDTAISIWGSSSAKWQNGILFYDPGFAPLSNTAKVITLQGSHTASSFVEAPLYAFTDNIFNFANFVVSGAGNVTSFGNNIEVLHSGFTFLQAGSSTVDMRLIAHDASSAGFVGTASNHPWNFWVNSIPVAQVSSTGLRLGVAGTLAGVLGFQNATSGTINLQPVTGALGSQTINIPAASGTVAVSATSPLSLSAAGALSVTTGTLSKTDDTNVTLTLGGTPTNALLNSVSIAAGWTGQLAVTRGGTGLSTTTQGDILYADASNSLAKLAKSTSSTRYLSNTGTSNNPAWAQIDLTNGVTGTLPAGSGGTGITSLGTGVPAALGVNVGSAGAFVTFNGALGTPSSGTAMNLTGLPISTGVSGLGTGIAAALAVNTGSAGAPVLLNGAGGTPSSLTLTNATGLPVAGGGTGAATFTTNGVLYGNTTSAIQVTAQGGANTVLTANAGAPSFSNSPNLNSFTLKAAGSAPTIECFASTCAFIWFSTSGSTTGQRIGFGSDPAVNDLFRVYGATLAANIMTMNAGSGAIAMPSIALTAQTNVLCFNSGTGNVTYQTWASGCVTSSARFKDGIKAISPERSFEIASRLVAVSYHYKPDADLGSDEHIGFTAEQVAEVAPELVEYEKDGRPRTVKYQELTPILAGAFQYLKAANDNLETRLSRSERVVRYLQAANDNLETRLSHLERAAR